MRWTARAALKSLGNFTAFSGPKYKGGRADGTLHNKDLLVINNQNGHQFLYAPANTTKINSSSSTHILSGGLLGQHQGTLHQIQQQQQQQQQQQMYSGNGTLSNLSGTGAQSNNYYYGLMGLTPLFPQQQHQSQLQHHMSQHHLNQQQQQHQMSQQQALAPASYHHQANKSTISTESANSTPSSSGVESGSTSMQQQQQQQQQQATCLMMNNDYSLMGHMANYGQHQNPLAANQPQPTLTLNAHYSSSGGPMNMVLNSNQQQQQPQQHHQRLNTGNSMREHIYECVDDDKPYSARLLLPMSLNFGDQQQQQQFNSNTLSQHQTMSQQQQMNSSRAMTLSTRLSAQQQQQQQQQQQVSHVGQSQNSNKRLFSHPAIVRDNQTKTNIICSKMAQVTPQRATEINKFQQDMMAIYNSSDTTTTSAANSSSSGNSSASYSQAGSNSLGGACKLSTDC